MLALTIKTVNVICTTVGLMAFSTTTCAYKFTLALVLVVAKPLLKQRIGFGMYGSTATFE